MRKQQRYHIGLGVGRDLWVARARMAGLSLETNMCFLVAGSLLAETPVDGPTLFENFLRAVPWEDPQPEMMLEVKDLLKQNFVSRVSHFSKLDIKCLKLPEEVPRGATLGRSYQWSCFELGFHVIRCRLYSNCDQVLR